MYTKIWRDTETGRYDWLLDSQKVFRLRVSSVPTPTFQTRVPKPESRVSRRKPVTGNNRGSFYLRRRGLKVHFKITLTYVGKKHKNKNTWWRVTRWKWPEGNHIFLYRNCVILFMDSLLSSNRPLQHIPVLTFVETGVTKGLRIWRQVSDPYIRTTFRVGGLQGFLGFLWRWLNIPFIFLLSWIRW